MQKHQHDGNVKVVCRFRPLNSKEIELGTEVMQEVSNHSTVRIRDNKSTEPHTFSLDHIFDIDSTQEQIYEVAAKPVVSSVLEGFNGTIFAYGQTSSGKTHTMQGYNIEVPSNKGIIPRMVQQVFMAIEKSPENIEFRLKVSIVQLYMEKIRDLLDVSKQDLKIRSHVKKGIYIEDATEKYVSEMGELYSLMGIGNQNRASCSTNMNERSSRSHMIFLITISQTNLTDLSAKTGKLFLVDLAGSEKISKTGAEGQVLNEAKKINLSLTTLGKVIKALTESRGSHVPYRESKLTRILQESLGGNSKTALVITCSPHPVNMAETISTLRFGVSAKKVSNKAKINKEMTVGELQHLLEKAEKEVSEKARIIKILEKYIADDLKAAVPSYEQILKTKESSPKGKVVLLEEQEDETQEQDENLLNQLQIVEAPTLNPLVEERVSVLEKEIEAYKAIMETQTEKLGELRLNYNLLHGENLEVQKQNELLKQEIKDAKKEKTRLRKKVDELEAPKPFEIQTGDRQFAKLLIDQVLQHIKSPEVKLQLFNSLKTQNWYSEVEAYSLDVQKFIQSQKERMGLKEIKPEETKQTIENNAPLNTKLIDIDEKLDYLCREYYDVISTQSTWKAECQLYERKIFKKCKMVSELEEEIEELKKELKRNDGRDPDTISVFQVTSNRLVKPIRGGSKVHRGGSKLFF